MFTYVFALCTILLICNTYSEQRQCKLNDDVSIAMGAVLCAVEDKRWKIPPQSNALLAAGCLLGGRSRCEMVMKVPSASEVPPSPPPKSAKNKMYQELAMKAERVVPKIWWRDGFASDYLLLSHNDSELPKKHFEISSLANKKLKNIYQCVTRQQFIRKTLDLTYHSSSSDVKSKCSVMDQPMVRQFFDLFLPESELIGGSLENNLEGRKVWTPSNKENGKLLLAALDVLDYFYGHSGGIWTGCFKLDKSAECRGALAAASLVVSSHVLYDIAAKNKSFTESQFVRGYILASLGRGLLHGDTSGTGNLLLTKWKLRLADFIALQSAYLRVYIDSFGALYSSQLNKYIPLAFPPSFTVYSKQQWRKYSQSLEPVYTSLRNWMFTETGSLIDFGPYLPLVAFPEARRIIQATTKRRVLIDVGANGFFASPKYLLDSYIPYLPFTHAIMIEPEPHFSATIPKSYSDRYNITFQQIYAEVATGSDTDMLKLIPKLVNKDDFVVLKFDVDPNRYAYGPTMEWGFLFSIMQNPSIAQLLDEVYIELHFNFPTLYWDHYHSNWEALDCIRYLRSQGVIVHAWP